MCTRATLARTSQPRASTCSRSPWERSSRLAAKYHTSFVIYYLAGDCIFPHEGIFGVVLQGGEVHIGDDIQVVKLGDGTCSFTPDEALKEVEQARHEGTL